MALVACGGDDDGGPTVQEDPNKLSFTTGEFEIEPGDTFTCFYLDEYTEKELAVVNGHGQQGPGGHHILVYYADEPREPGSGACNDADMVNLHQISGSGGQDALAAEGSILGLPDGLALKVPAGKQLVLQAHYINTSGKTMTVNDTVSLDLADPKDVEAYVNYFVLADLALNVPPQSDYTRATECKLDKDYDIILGLGHMHEQGKHFKLEQIDEQGKSTVLRDDPWSELYVSHPPVSYFTKEEPLKLKKGTTVRQTCNWNNTTAEPLLFPREMCVTFLYYFPGEGDIECNLTEVETTQ
jgi:hypothetical protein